MSVGSADDMRETAELLDKIKGSIVTTYASNSTLDADTLSDMMATETWFSAAEAVENGLATGTIEGGQTVTNIAKPWIQNGPKPEQIAQDDQTQTAWRIALNKRRMGLIE
jgi:hypothetical protein